MRKTTSVGDAFDTVEAIDAAVERNLEWAIMSLDDVIDGLLDGQKSGAKEIKPLLADLRRAQTAAITERQKLDEERRKRGGLGAGELDLDAARSEILDRLARRAR